MQHYPGDPRPARIPGARPALPGATSPATPTITPPQHPVPQLALKKRPNHARRAIRKLVVTGVFLEALYLALYPLLAGGIASNDAARQAMLGIFPWLPRLYWTTWLPALNLVLAHVAVLDPAEGGNANLLALLLAVAFVLLLLAARAGSRVARERLTPSQTRGLFWIILLLAGVFSLTFFFVPGMLSQDMFLYGLYGRAVIVYHVNPYLVSPATFPQDILHAALLKGTKETIVYGPVEIDLSILVGLLSGQSIANVMLGFRLLGLLAHLVNVLLIWAILVKLKPEARMAATLLYAWNPLVLLMSVAEMHQAVVVVLFVLLAVFLLQRKSLTLGWVFLLLAALINYLCLLLLPLFLYWLRKEVRVTRRGEGFLWWLGLISVSALVVVLAYTPYWQGWGLAGLADSLRQSFLPASAENSLNAALLHLPLRLPPALAWFVAPQHWLILAGVTVLGVLLFGLWLADTLRLVLLFSSWLFLALVVLFPIYWPWYTLLPLALALCSAGRGTTLLAMLLTMGAALSYYYLAGQSLWAGQALLIIGLPMLLWGWTLFFTSTWQMMRPKGDSQPPARARRGLSRPSWTGTQRHSFPSRPSRPSWPARRR